MAGGTSTACCTPSSNCSTTPSSPTVKRWREAGGKVVGHPGLLSREIAHAAGMLPFRCAARRSSPKSTRTRTSARTSARSSDVARAGREQARRARAVRRIPSCDAARNLAAVFGQLPVPVPDPLPAAERDVARGASFSRGRVRAARPVQRIAGVTITDDALRNSIAVFQPEPRAAAQALRDQARDAVAGRDARGVRARGGRQAHAARGAQRAAPRPCCRCSEQRTAKHDRVRVVFEGRLLRAAAVRAHSRAIGRSCYVVDDDLLIGLRWILADLPVTGDPLDALAWGYLERSSYSPDAARPAEAEGGHAAPARAQSNASAVISPPPRYCEPGLEEQVAYVHALDEAKLPYFVTEFEGEHDQLRHARDPARDLRRKPAVRLRRTP